MDSKVNVEAARTFFERLHKKDIDAWGELWQDDGKIIVMYPPEGFDDVKEGKPAILTAFHNLFSHFDSFESHIQAIYAGENPNVVCVEYTPRVMLTDGYEYTNTNLALFIFRNNLISEYHDYFDPRRFQAVVERLQVHSPQP